MCGIAGIVKFNELIDTEYINQMTDVISYRGPDDEGALVVNENKEATPFKRSDELTLDKRYGKIILGHRRLSIIDLSIDGHQPMTYADSGLWITYNGELYNYIELREELISSGYLFKTQTDTEVVLAAYHKWGEGCLRKFNGMWSFSILDLKNEVLFCSTDQFSIKPFYYYNDENGFYFSSEIKQLLQLPWIKKDIDLGYFVSAFGYSKPKDYFDETIVKNLKRLNTGYYIKIISVFSGSVEIIMKRWHQFSTVPTNHSISMKEAKEKLYDLLYDSINIRLRSDVPIGTALSGGIDSSTIVMLMDKILKETKRDYVQKTFTVCSEVENMDEAKYAKELLKLTNAKGFFVTPSAEGFIRDFEKMYYHLELPFASSSCYASWCVYKLSKDSSVIVTLDGQGADEIFGGYDIYMYPYYQMEFLLKGNYSQFYQNSTFLKSQYNLNIGKQFTQILKKNAANIYSLKTKYETRRIENDTMFSKELIEVSRVLLQKKNNVMHYDKGGKFTGSFSNYLKDTFYKISLPSLLRVVDRNSMAHSIEARVPFLDYRILEFAYSLPHNFKINKGISKYIFKETVRDLLPDNILNRPKLGFVTSEKIWFEKDKELLKEYINLNIKPMSDLLDKSKIDSLFDFNNPSNNSTNKLWRVLSLCSIFKNFELTVN